MNVTELRIGNYVHNNVESFPIKAKDLMFLLAFDNEHYAEPIPLTEEWLLKLGFKPNEYQNGWLELGSLYISKDKFELGFYDSEYGVGEYSIELKHVHQLQNLFFAITGKELSCG